MALFFRRNYHFYRFKFPVLASAIGLTSKLLTSGPTLLTLNPLDYKVWRQCWSLNTRCNKSQKHFPSLKMYFS